jgi:nucleotide-binding universal stress UspA family protein
MGICNLQFENALGEPMLNGVPGRAEHLKKDKTISHTINTFCHQHDINVVFVGVFGNNGKELGSFTNELLHKCIVNCFLVQRHAFLPEAGQGIRFLVGVDGSEVAHHAFDSMMSMHQSNDHVSVVHYSRHYGDKDKSILGAYEQRCASLGANADVKFVPRDISISMSDELLKYADENNYHCLVLGSTGFPRDSRNTEARLGSVASACIRHAHRMAFLVVTPYQLRK